MKAQIGLMIEGQLGLTWARWKRILQTAEDGGYQSVFRSDHFTTGPNDFDSLELWASLTYAAAHTERIEFGPLVAPVTFRHPSMTVRYAAAVDDLSEGRLVLGMGAGWNEREHKQFGLPFYDFPTRFDMLEEALEITSRLFFTDGPVTYAGRHFSLEEAQLLPRPKRPGGPPILIGGAGPKRTLPLVARYAEEWNTGGRPIEEYKERAALLDELLKTNGREPSDVKRSMMVFTVLAADGGALQTRLDELGQMFDQEMKADELRARGAAVGTVSEIVDRLGRYAEAGVERFMLQWFFQEDIAGMEQVASAVLPHFH